VDDITGILAIVFIFGWPGILIGMHMIRGQFNERHRRRERAAARRMYERVMHHKLEVIETALAMGYTHGQADLLDRRLEQLIGAERMKALLDPATPGIPSTGELPTDDDLKREIVEMRKEREKV
jgi:hypothetical protein